MRFVSNDLKNRVLGRGHSRIQLQVLSLEEVGLRDSYLKKQLNGLGLI